jgi:hypothetical protein
MFTRSSSAGDLRGIALVSDVVPKTDYIATWILKFGKKVIQITAPENSEVQDMCDRAAVQLGIGIKQWQTTIERKGTRIFVTCVLPESIDQEAVIHFGGIEWAGKVRRSYDDETLVQEAQVQRGIEGRWSPRESLVVNDVRIIEAIKS